MSVVVRWKLYDTVADETAALLINPNKMDGPEAPRNMQWAWGSRWGLDRMRGIDLAPSQPTSWTFSGVILTKGHYDQLLAWTKRNQLLHVTDHLDRTFEIMIQQYDPVERLPTATRPWRADYTMTCLFLGRI